MEKNNFLLYKDFESTLDLLNDEQAGKLFKAIYSYVNGRNEPNFESDGMLVVAFNIIKTQLERDLIKYKKRATASKENGKKGGRPPKKALETNTNQTKPNKPTRLLNNQTEPRKGDSDSVSVRDSVSDSEREKKYNSLTLKHFDDDELNDLFIDFLKMRKKLKAVNSERAVRALLNKLSPLTKQEKIESINNSIMNSWKGLFPNTNKPKQESYSSFDVGKELFGDDYNG